MSNYLSKVGRFGRIAWHWMLRPSAELDYLPEDISIEVTNSCNFKCSYCPQSDPKHFEIVERTMLSAEDLSLFLTRIRTAGVQTPTIHWTLDGEPFVNKKFAELAKLARDHGFTQHVFSTNGTLATVKRLKAFPKGIELKLCIDFCADVDYFERVRGTTGSWGTVYENITGILADPELENVQIKVTDISSFDCESAEELERRVKALEATFPDMPRLTITTRVFHNAAGFLKGSAGKPPASYNLCPYPWTSVVIASNGDVVACCRDLQHKTVLGNLKDETLEQIWFGDRYRALRQDLIDQKPARHAACAGCDMPYDDAKFSPKALARAAIHRLQIVPPEVANSTVVRDLRKRLHI